MGTAYDGSVSTRQITPKPSYIFHSIAPPRAMQNHDITMSDVNGWFLSHLLVTRRDAGSSRRASLATGLLTSPPPSEDPTRPITL